MIKTFFLLIAGLYLFALLDIIIYNCINNMKKNKTKNYFIATHPQPKAEEIKEKNTACFLNEDISIPIRSNTFKELEMQKTKKDADVIILKQDLANAMKINIENELENETYQNYSIIEN